MSADNWTICPKCSHTWIAKRDAAINKAKKQYGKISADEYEAKLLEAKQIEPEDKPATLREDYEIGMYDGVVELNYSCSCHECGFTFEIRQKWTPDSPANP